MKSCKCWHCRLIDFMKDPKNKKFVGESIIESKEEDKNND